MTTSSTSQMPPQQKRPLEDFFKPYSRSGQTIPQKRSSPSGTEQEGRNTIRKSIPKTPAKTVTFKDVTPKSIRSPFFSPKSQNSLPIRSPKTCRSLSPSQSRQTILFKEVEKSPSKDVKTNTSFTFSDISERSQKVVDEGKVVAVRDSEDDTDSLESLDDIFGRKKDAVINSDSSPPEDLEAERVKTLMAFTSGRSVPIVGKDKLRALHAKERAIKFDLRIVLDDHLGDEEAERNISRMRADLDGEKDSQEEDYLDKELLASVVKTADADQEDVERLLNAVERTEALSTDKKFRFFKSDGLPKARSPRRDTFPRSAIPYQMWTPNEQDVQDRAYLSGYMSDLASSEDLDGEALRWTFNQVVKENRIDLRWSYIDCLKACSKTWMRLNITAADVQHMFQALGAGIDSIRDATSIEPKHHYVDHTSKLDYKYLLSALQMYQGVCHDMDFPALSKLSSIVLRLILDDLVMSNNQVCTATESLLRALLNLPDEEVRSRVYDRLFIDAAEHIQDPQLQVQLLSHILPTSQHAVDLRKALADTFLLGLTSGNIGTKPSPVTIKDLSAYISTSQSFSLTRHVTSSATDYAALTALVQILDVAISSGDIPPPAISESADISTIPAKTLSIDSAFNMSVDTLADRLHTLFVSIKDTGASHMRRTEAKDVLHALYFRLLYSVRTKVRRKKHVFDSNGEIKGAKGRWINGEEWRERERGGEFMKRFLGKKEGKMV